MHTAAPLQDFPSVAEQVLPWALKQDFFEELLLTPQDEIWHAEGNVAIHTRMVIEAYLESASPTFEGALACAFHDIAKPKTTEMGADGRIHAPGHARLGSRMTQELLWGLLKPSQRNLVVELVRLHGQPLHLWEGDQSMVISAVMSQTAPLDLLAEVVKADLAGRICTDPEDTAFTRFELWKEEIKNWPSPYAFWDEVTATKAFYGYLELLPTAPIPFCRANMEVHFLCGLPGAGKDTYYKQNLSHLPMLSLDDLRRKHRVKRGDQKAEGQLYQLAQEEFRNFLRHEGGFVFNATNVTKSVRRKWVQLAMAYNAKTIGHYIEPSREVLLHQNRKREHCIPEQALIELFGKLEVPHPFEFHQTHYIW